MRNKTAIQKLAVMIEDRIGVSTMADQSKEGIIGYQMALVGIKLELKHLLESEKEQIKDAWIDGFKSSSEGWNGEMLPHYEDGEQRISEHKEEYYEETYGNGTQEESSGNN